jgi:HPr kinase/phosphorylase
VDAPDHQIVAGTTIARRGRAILIRGASGSGKSDLALRALTLPLKLPGEPAASTFELISDDQTVITRSGGRLRAYAPDTIAGRIEVRGLGIVDWPIRHGDELVLVADTATATPERMPQPEQMRTRLLGVALPRIDVVAVEASAHLKMALALQRYTLNDTDV